MVRNILSVIVAYVVMGIFVGGSFFILYTVLKAGGSFRPDSWDPSPMWVGMSIVIGLVGAVIGGAVCRLLSRSKGAVIGLAVAVAVIGGIMAVMQLQREAPTEPRPEELSMADAMNGAVQPAWLAIANPIVGVIGIGIGGCLLFGSKGDSPARSDES